LKFFYATRPVGTLTVKQNILPWDFEFDPASIPEDARKNKAARQAWYSNPTTSHYFYTGIEGANDNMRPSNENAPRTIHAFVADYDMPIPPDEVKEAIERMKIKPSWWERSLGGNHRLVWLLEVPMQTGDAEFTRFILQKAVKWLDLNKMVGLDEPAFTAFSRLYCCGDSWEDLHNPPIPENDSQAFLVKNAEKFNFKGGRSGFDIPQEVKEARLKERYPNFNWPSDFTVESKGPTFWVPESVSPMSAVLKENGIFTFSAHALKRFYFWPDLLGADFVEKFENDATAESTKDTWYDGKNYWWRDASGAYKGWSRVDTDLFLESNGISAKTDPNGMSKLKKTIHYINVNHRVLAAGPFVCQPEGIIQAEGEGRMLNIYHAAPVQPAPEAGIDPAFGEDFPFIWDLIRGLLNSPEQLDYLLAWFKRFYESALLLKPTRGHNIMIMGPAGVGKSLVANEIFAAAVGGSKDASDYMLRTQQFGGELFDKALWLVEDDSPSEDARVRSRFHNKLKQMAANDQHRCSQKYQVPSQVEWFGRICITANTDFNSAAIIPPMDTNTGDKMCLFRTVEARPNYFGSREEIQASIRGELPYFLRALLKWVRPEHVKQEPNGERFGFEAYHNPSLLRLSHQVNDATSFAEVVSHSLMDHFRVSPKATEWRGTSTEIFRLVLGDPQNSILMRQVSIMNFPKKMNSAAKAELFSLKFKFTEGSKQEWCFYRPDNL
jgi:hypothetical protein